MAELKARMAQGGIREAAIRAMIYLAGTEPAADERGFAVLRQIRAEHGYDIPLSEFKDLVREQFYMLLVDEDAAVGALSDLTRNEPARIPEAIDVLKRLAQATGTLSDDQAIRLARIEHAFAEASAQPIASPAKPSAGAFAVRREGQRKGSGQSQARGDTPAAAKAR